MYSVLYFNLYLSVLASTSCVINYQISTFDRFILYFNYNLYALFYRPLIAGIGNWQSPSIASAFNSTVVEYKVNWRQFIDSRKGLYCWTNTKKVLPRLANFKNLKKLNIKKCWSGSGRFCTRNRTGPDRIEKQPDPGPDRISGRLLTWIR